MAIPRMRTPHGAVEFLREQDPDCAITEHYIRRLIKTGQLPSVRAGVKYLVNVDLLIDYLKAEQTA